MFLVSSRRAWRRGLVRSAHQADHVGTTATFVSALQAGRRTYFWPYNEDFVPKGESTSRFQSSSVPSVRERIIREYALGPLFNERVPCCTLGFAGSAREVMGCKAALREVLAAMFSAESPEAVTFGPLTQTKEMLLLRPDTSESPRLGDGPRSRSDSAQCRRSRYARAPVQARTVLEVFFDPGEGLRGDAATASSSGAAAVVSAEEGDAESDAVALGRLIQTQLEEVSAASPDDADTETRQLRLAAKQLRELGVVYCELPEQDVSDYMFDQLHGAAVDDELVERVMDRWERRMKQLEEREVDSQALPAPSAVRETG